MSKEIAILMMDRKYLDKHMKDLPGLAGVKGEGLPGVPFKEDDGEIDMGYCTKCGSKLKHNDDCDDDHDEDDDYMKKQETGFFKAIKMIASKLFNGNTMSAFSPLYSEVDGVSVIEISGEIGKRLSLEDKQNGKVDVDDITKALKQANNAGTKACLLHINSPGGVSTGIEECGDVIYQLEERMPVFAYCDTVCASAAYWLAACTNGVFCSKSSELGSVGVYAKVVDMSENLKMNGINMQIFSAGSMKTMGQPETPLSETEAKYIQDDIDQQYGKFVKVVKDNRGNVADEYLQGQLFSGEKAVEANLADEIVPDMETCIGMISGE